MEISPFFKIPREIRDEIYQLTLDLPTSAKSRERFVVTVSQGSRPLLCRFTPPEPLPWEDEFPSTGLLYTSRAVSEESTALLYSRAVFSFYKESQDAMWKTLLWFLDVIGEKNRRNLRGVSVDAPWVMPLIECPHSGKVRPEGIWWLKLTRDGFINWPESLGWTVSPLAQVAVRWLSTLSYLALSLRMVELTVTAELVEMLWKEKGSEAANKAQFEALEMISKAFRGTNAKVVLNLEYQSNIEPCIQEVGTALGWEIIRPHSALCPNQDLISISNTTDLR